MPTVAGACCAVLLSVALEAPSEKDADDGRGDATAAAAQATLLPLLPRLSQALLGRWAEPLAAAVTSGASKTGVPGAASLPAEHSSLLSAASAAVFASAAAALRAGLLPIEDADAAGDAPPSFAAASVPASPDQLFRFLHRFAAAGGAPGGGAGAAGGGPAALVVPQAMVMLEATLASALAGGWADESAGVLSFEAGFASLLTVARAAASASASASSGAGAPRDAAASSGAAAPQDPSSGAATAADILRTSGLRCFRGVSAILSARQVEKAIRGLTAALVAASSQPPGRGGTAVASATAAADLLLVLLQAQGASLYNANSQQLQAAVVAALGTVTAPQWDAACAGPAAAVEIASLRCAVS